jgi:hypothetical protein
LSVSFFWFIFKLFSKSFDSKLLILSIDFVPGEIENIFSSFFLFFALVRIFGTVSYLFLVKSELSFTFVETSTKYSESIISSYIFVLLAEFLLGIVGFVGIMASLKVYLF